MKVKVTEVKSLKLEIEYTITNSSGIIRPIQLSSTFKTAKAAARWYAEHRNCAHWGHLPYNPNKDWYDKVYRRVLPIFKKHLK